MPAGLIFFDAEDRLVLWNKRYDELYPETADVRRPGLRFEDLLRIAVARGVQPDAVGREEEWIAQRLKERAALSTARDQLLSNGRWLRVEDRRTRDGGVVGIRVDITELKQREAEQKLQNMRFSAAVQNIAQGLAMFDRDQKLIVCNRRYAEVYGIPVELTKPGTTLRQILESRVKSGIYSGSDPNKYIRDRMENAAAGKPTDTILELTNGRIVSISHRPMVDGGWVSTHEDITDRRRIEKQRDRGKAFLDLVIENVPATIVVKDARDLKYVLINRAGEHYYGMPRGQMIGKTAHEVLPAGSAELVTALDRELLHSDGRPVRNEHIIEMPDRTKRVGMSTRLPILDENGRPQYLLAVIEDITDRKRLEATERQAQEALKYLAYHDELTKLPNRVCLYRDLEQMLAAGPDPLAIAICDLDGFKDVNNTLGHAVGDQLLVAVAQRLRAIAPDSERVYRLGGDEFVVTFPGVADPAEVGEAVNRMLRRLAEPYEINHQRLDIAAAAGIVLAHAHGSTAQQLIANADLALFRAKMAGPGQHQIYLPDLRAHAEQRRRLNEELRRAFKNNEFELFFQPQLRLSDGAVVGAEALLRWRHPERGVLAPGAFIDVLESSTIASDVGLWILQTACEHAAIWRKDGDALRVGVNLFPVQFREGSLNSRVETVLRATSLPPEALELEITENIALGQDQAVLGPLQELRQKGIALALDDFGTGYASLSYLTRYPVTRVKIDRSFVQKIGEDTESATIVRSLIALARNLDLNVTAEGVETAAQAAFLKAEGCGEVQGYLYAKPLAASQFECFLTEARTRPIVAECGA